MSFSQSRSLVGHKGGVLCVCFSPTGQYVLSGGQDRAILLWNSESGKCVTRFVEGGHGQDVRDIQCSSDSAQLISGGQDKQFLIWDVARCSVSRKVMRAYILRVWEIVFSTFLQIRAHDAEINCVRYGPENGVALTGSTDKKVNIWDMKVLIVFEMVGEKLKICFFLVASLGTILRSSLLAMLVTE